MLGFIIVFMTIFCLFAGVPISLALGIPTVIYFIASDIPLQMVTQRIFGGIDSFTLLAIPFFMFAGRLMNDAGITDKIVNLSKATTGAIRGGLAQVNILGSMFFAGISGASTADIASIGTVLINAMKKEGYSAEYSVAITAMSSQVGPIIPPSIVFILYGVLSGSSIIGLFLAGIVPGVLFGLALMLVVHLEGRKQNFPKGEPTSFRKFRLALADASLAMGLPFIILGGMLSGVFTATEAGAVAAVYSTFLGVFVYRKIIGKQFTNCLKYTAIDTANVMLIIGVSSVFAWMLVIEEMPDKMGYLLMSISDNPIIIFLIINILLLLIGTMMDNFPSMIITIPILLPIVQELGMSSLQFGVVITVNLLIGGVTPPVGVGLYLASTIGKTSIEKSAWAAKWMLLASIIVVLLITYVPAISMTLPNLFGYK